MAFPMVPGFEITKLWDEDRREAEKMAKIYYNKPRICDTIEEVSDDVDLVFIADCSGDGSDKLKFVVNSVGWLVSRLDISEIPNSPVSSNPRNVFSASPETVIHLSICKARLYFNLAISGFISGREYSTTFGAFRSTTTSLGTAEPDFGARRMV